MASMKEIFNKKDQALLKKMYANANKMVALLEKNEEIKVEYKSLQEAQRELVQRRAALYEDMPMSMMKPKAIPEVKKPIEKQFRLHEPRPSKEYTKEMFDLLTSI